MKTWVLESSLLRAGLFTLTLSLLLSACGKAEPEAQEAQPATTESAADESSLPESAPSALTDTHWKLVEFQSMDDSIGTITPAPDRSFTMHLAADGSVAMQLDCNQGTGSWHAEAGDDGTTGSFHFGPLATTRAACPPPHLDERIAADTASVTGFALRDGRLHLSLMADAGIYVWEPAAQE